MQQEHMCAMLLKWLQDHWQELGAFATLLFISFVNAMPDKWDDWSTYQVTHQTLLGIIPISRRTPVLPSKTEAPPPSVGK